jgi:hypothetical protein
MFSLGCPFKDIFTQKTPSPPPCQGFIYRPEDEIKSEVWLKRNQSILPHPPILYYTVDECSIILPKEHLKMTPPSRHWGASLI